ncbi:12249_t:CDS:2 [Dentiscutata erythropus]|uniref:12249_t:CDS:1 n=1 Tax=Dentiscutata erythropus TaxID=1348616 RepID=A0A9N9B3G2_9GLOM|nr:12249_t:CDS:2 [Dentiscutata erythropus]
MSELNTEELPKLLSKVSELEEVSESIEYLTLFFLLLFLEISLFNLLDSGVREFPLELDRALIPSN